jgi:hypothetical protein
MFTIGCLRSGYAGLITHVGRFDSEFDSHYRHGVYGCDSEPHTLLRDRYILISSADAAG